MPVELAISIPVSRIPASQDKGIGSFLAKHDHSHCVATEKGEVQFFHLSFAYHP